VRRHSGRSRRVRKFGRADLQGNGAPSREAWLADRVAAVNAGDARSTFSLMVSSGRPEPPNNVAVERAEHPPGREAQQRPGGRALADNRHPEAPRNHWPTHTRSRSNRSRCSPAMPRRGRTAGGDRFRISLEIRDRVYEPYGRAVYAIAYSDDPPPRNEVLFQRGAVPLRSSGELLSTLDGLASIEEPKQLAIGE
jgi:hypothetical protein